MEIDKAVMAGRGVEHLHGAEPGDAAHLRIDNALDQRRRHCRVDRVATLHQHLGAGLRRFGLGGHDHCFGCHLSGLPSGAARPASARTSGR